jgi:hypothetical protein
MGEKPTGVTEENQGHEPGVVGGEGDPGSGPAEGHQVPSHSTSTNA